MLQDLQDYRIVSFKAPCCLQRLFFIITRLILFLPYFYWPQTITLTVIFDRSKPLNLPISSNGGGAVCYAFNP